MTAGSFAATDVKLLGLVAAASRLEYLIVETEHVLDARRADRVSVAAERGGLRRADDQHPGPDLCERGIHVLPYPPMIQRRRNRTQHRHAEQHFDELGPIRGPQRHAVALAHTESRQHAGQAARAIMDLGVGPDDVLKDHGLALRPSERCAREKGIEPLRASVFAAHPASFH